MTEITSSQKQAELLKDQGNLYFKKNRLGAAIEAYTEAITLRPDVPIYWTNRALCHRKRNDWERVEADCWKALELDKKSVKAHYMLGLALLQSERYEEAVKQLEKALELGRGGKPTNYMVEEIWQEVAKARYSEWEQVSGPWLQRLKELRKFCEKALQESYENTAGKVKESKGFLNVGNLDDILTATGKVDTSMQADEAKDKRNELNLELSALRNSYQDQLQTLSKVFEKVSQQDIPGEIPEYLCCKITMDIFRDPVITPSGVTYERAVLLEHLNKVGRFDPLTRAPLQPDQLVANLAVKEAVQVYLSEHGWAYKSN
eukprot:c26182_g3_i1 orf=428-1378(+)